MNYVTIKSSAKINLSLDVIEKRDDGYHNIDSIFQSVGIYDIITVSKLEENVIRITCDKPDVPCDKTNIVYKAAEIFYKNTNINGGVSINIQKNIPSQAGLGGGSSDGAGVLYALNLIYDTKIDGKKLTELGAMVSADTAFFLVGGTAHVSGIGNIIKSTRYIPNIDLVIAKGESGISTPQAYKKIDSLVNHKRIKTEKLLKAIDKGKFISECELCGNIFEEVADNKDVNDIKAKMLSMGAINSVMSGSGSAVFGIFKEKDKAIICADELKKIYPYAVHCKTTSDSIIVI